MPGRDRSSLIPKKVEVWFPAVACSTPGCQAEPPEKDFYVVISELKDVYPDLEDEGFDGAYIVHDTAAADYGCTPAPPPPPSPPCDYCPSPQYPIFDYSIAQCCTPPNIFPKVCVPPVKPPNCPPIPLPSFCDPCRQGTTGVYTELNQTLGICCDIANITQCIPAPPPPTGCPGSGGYTYDPCTGCPQGWGPFGGNVSTCENPANPGEFAPRHKVDISCQVGCPCSACPSGYVSVGLDPTFGFYMCVPIGDPNELGPIVLIPIQNPSPAGCDGVCTAPPPFNCFDHCGQGALCVYDTCGTIRCVGQTGPPICQPPTTGTFPTCLCPPGTLVQDFLNFPFYRCVPGNCLVGGGSPFVPAAVPRGPLDPKNKDELDKLAKQIAKDYYRWRVNAFDEVYIGITEYKGDGITDWAEFHMTADDAWTRVYSGPTNIDVEEMQHKSGATCDASSGVLCGDPVVKQGGSRCLTTYKIDFATASLEKVGTGCCVATCCSSSSSHGSCCDSENGECDPLCVPLKIQPKTVLLSSAEPSTPDPLNKCFCHDEEVKDFPLTRAGCSWVGTHGNASFMLEWIGYKWNLYVQSSNACPDGSGVGAVYTTLPEPPGGINGGHVCCNQGTGLVTDPLRPHGRCAPVFLRFFVRPSDLPCKCIVCGAPAPPPSPPTPPGPQPCGVPGCGCINYGAPGDCTYDPTTQRCCCPHNIPQCVSCPAPCYFEPGSGCPAGTVWNPVSNECCPTAGGACLPCPAPCWPGQVVTPP